MAEHGPYYVAVVGAGPAGLFAAKELANQGAHVVLFNRDIKPGGLAEYGIYPNKHKMKEGLRNQFRQILASQNIDYFGNIMIGQHGDLSLEDLQQLGFQAILVTVGAQGTKWLGLPGEDLKGVYHAKDLVYHYNRLPPFSQEEFAIGRRVAIIGIGNVMTDIACYLIRELKVDEVVAIARRGPGEIKFEKHEISRVIANLDLDDLDLELGQSAELMRSLGQDPEAAKAEILSALDKADPRNSDTHLRLRFLLSPTQILGDDDGYTCGLEVEQNTLYLKDGEVKARGIGVRKTLDVDTVIFAIGDKVDEGLGLPVVSNEFVKNQTPRFPVDGISFECYDPQKDTLIPNLFVAGWSRNASHGLVGIARKDGTSGARALLEYLKSLQPLDELPVESLHDRLSGLSKPVIDKDLLARLEATERMQAIRRGLEEYKFRTNEEMLAVLEKVQAG